MRFRQPDDKLLPWPMSQSINVARAATMLGCSSSTVLNMIEEGRIRAYKLRPDRAHSPWRIEYDSVLAYINRLERQ